MNREFPHVTCLGCGCACDDIVLTVRDDHIVHAERACPLGVAWFGDGRVPAAVRIEGQEAGAEQALDAAAAVLGPARGRVLVFLADDISCEAQRQAVAIADRLGAMVDGVVSEPAAAGILAGQRRGRAGCTLGEIRNRADLLVFWGTDPDEQYPRYSSRYAVYPPGLYVPRGRRGRTVASVSVGTDRGPDDADLSITLSPDDEVPALAALRARLLNRSIGDGSALSPELMQLAGRMTASKYVAIVYDGEPGAERRRPERAEGLITLTQTLNGPTRASLSTLRGGGNRSGAEAVLTWQTGFPFAVDFSRGAPRYRPDRRAADLLQAGAIGAALVAGNPASLPATLHAGMGAVPTVVIGPRASEAPFPARIAIDTGVAGIHEGGIAYRMDDVPLPLEAALPAPRTAVQTLESLLGRLSHPEAKA